MFPSIPTSRQENPIKLGMGRICPVGYLNKGFLEELPRFPLRKHLPNGCRLEPSAKWETFMSMLVSNRDWSSPVWLLGSSNVEDTNEQLHGKLKAHDFPCSYWLQIKQQVANRSNNKLPLRFQQNVSSNNRDPPRVPLSKEGSQGLYNK